MLYNTFHVNYELHRQHQRQANGEYPLSERAQETDHETLREIVNTVKHGVGSAMVNAGHYLIHQSEAAPTNTPIREA